MQDMVYTIFQLPTVSASTVTNCQNSPITSVTAIGSDGNVPSNAIDGNLAGIMVIYVPIIL